MSDSHSFVFQTEEYFPEGLYRLVCDLRAKDPVAVYKATQTRQPRKSFLPPDGRLLLLAADHPGRGLISLGDDALRLADRRDYLARLVRVLLGGAFDGVMGTPDVLEELCIIQQILRENNGPAFLDGKIFVASANRGGVIGSEFEMDDTFTAFTADRAKHLGCDALKVSLKLDLESKGSGRTLEHIASFIGRCNDAAMPVFLECCPVSRGQGGHYETVFEIEAFAQALCIASALGETSTRTWLRVPYFEGLERALAAVSLPVVIQGGPPRAGVADLLREVEGFMRSCPTVRGVMMGRPILFPGDDDPLAVAAAIETVVRRGVPAEALVERLDQARGARIDVLTTLIGEGGWHFEGGTQTASYTAGGVGTGRA
jgi:DhnA family fructose-bisphosphate aldolase class Ia